MAEISDITRLNLWNEASFHWLYDEYYKSLVGYAMRLLGDMGRAEDIVQELIVSIYDTRRQFASFQALRTYLYNSVRNRCIDVLRHLSVVDGYSKAVASHGEATTEDDDDSYREEFYRRLFRLIDAMPSRQRDVFVAAMDGMSNKEIAEKLGVSIDTVKTQKKRGMKLLRTNMNAHDVVLLLLLLP